MTRNTPTVWYKNCLYQMEDQEMVWLQCQDSGACAVWEWLKADCWKRGSAQIRSLSDIEKDGIARMLGINVKRFDNVISMMVDDLKWIDSDMKIRSWEKWQSISAKEADADRQYVKYWKDKAREEGDPELPPELQDDKFRIAWEEYLKYRTENRWKPLRAMSIERKWRELAGWGLDGAIESIEQTIRNGWQGLFVPQSRVTKDSKDGTVGKKPSFWELKQKITMIEEEMKDLRGRYFSGPPSSTWEKNQKGQEAKSRWRELKQKVERLKSECIN